MKMPDIISTLYYKTNLPEIQDIENYQQLPNTCGLASVLMVARLGKRQKLKGFLDAVAQNIAPLLEECGDYIGKDVIKDEDFKYQLVLQYLLLKAFSNNGWEFFYEYLKEKLPGIYEDQKAVFLYTISSNYKKLTRETWQQNLHIYEDYLGESGKIYAKFLYEQSMEFKTDLELKILLSILGVDFIPSQTGDFTGAMFFDKDKTNKKKIKELILTYLHPNRMILFGKREHWVVVSGLYPKKKKDWHLVRGNLPESVIDWKKITVVYNDPMNSTQDHGEIVNLDPSERFYFFQNDDKSMDDLWEQILKKVSKGVLNEKDEIGQITLKKRDLSKIVFTIHEKPKINVIPSQKIDNPNSSKKLPLDESKMISSFNIISFDEVFENDESFTSDQKEIVKKAKDPDISSFTIAEDELFEE